MKSLLFLLFASACLPAVYAQDVAVERAVEIRFPASATKSYVLESSANLVDWEVIAPAIIGAGTEVRQFQLTNTNRQHFRVTSTAFEDLASVLAPIRTANNLPALGCVVLRSGKVEGLGVVGVRKQGVAEAVTRSDHWHHGSLTKSMTAVLAGLLVDEGTISWGTKLADLFPQHAGTRHASWNAVTLEMLLTNTSGAPGDLNPSGIWPQLWTHAGTPVEQRLFLTEQVTALPTQFAAGSDYEYSNAGVAMAGAMLEQVTNRSWENLMRERLFKPLGMPSGGFGTPATPRYVDQPWGHTFSGSTPIPKAPGPTVGNPSGIGPAGSVKCNLPDFGRYLAFHLAGIRGEGTLLQPATFQKLYTPVHSNYAMGWKVLDRTWGGGTVYHHTGSNTQWYTNVWLAPTKDWAVVAVTNIGGNAAFTATDQVVAAMIQRYLP